MLAVIHSATLLGIRGRPVSVEVHVGPGIPSFTVVGQPDTSCREAARQGQGGGAVEWAGLAQPKGHREPRPERGSQDRRRTRPRDRDGGPGRHRGRTHCGGREPRLPRRAGSRRIGSGGAGGASSGRCSRWVGGGGAHRIGGRGAPGGSPPAAPGEPAGRGGPGPAGRRSVARPTSRPTPRTGSDPLARPGRRPWSAAGPEGPGGRGRGRSSHAHDRAAGLWQDHAGHPPPGCPAHARTRGRPRRDAHPLCGSGEAPVRGPRDAATVPSAPPHHDDGRPRRRGHVVGSARRGVARTRRRPLPGRDGRVPPDRARRPPPTPGGGRHPREPGGGDRDLPRPLPPRRRHEPVPVRRRWSPRGLPMLRLHEGTLTRDASRDRSSTASTSESTCIDRRARSSWVEGRASPRPRWGGA